MTYKLIRHITYEIVPNRREGIPSKPTLWAQYAATRPRQKMVKQTLFLCAHFDSSNWSMPKRMLSVPWFQFLVETGTTWHVFVIFAYVWHNFCFVVESVGWMLLCHSFAQVRISVDKWHLDMAHPTWISQSHSEIDRFEAVSQRIWRLKDANGGELRVLRTWLWSSVTGKRIKELVLVSWFILLICQVLPSSLLAISVQPLAIARGPAGLCILKPFREFWRTSPKKFKPARSWPLKSPSKTEMRWRSWGHHNFNQ